MTPPWTIQELVEQASRQLAADPSPSNRQVSHGVDARSIRYYTTAGLVAKPSGYRGRTALYDRLHLAQLIAIKRLQVRGHSLAEIQLRMATGGASLLAELSGQPVERIAVPVAAPTVATAAPASTPRAEFWRREPAAVTVPAPAAVTAPAPAPVPELWVRVPLGHDAHVQIPYHPELDLARLSAAAEPLVQELVRQRAKTNPKD